MIGMTSKNTPSITCKNITICYKTLHFFPAVNTGYNNYSNFGELPIKQCEQFLIQPFRFAHLRILVNAKFLLFRICRIFKIVQA